MCTWTWTNGTVYFLLAILFEEGKAASKEVHPYVLYNIYTKVTALTADTVLS